MVASYKAEEWCWPTNYWTPHLTTTRRSFTDLKPRTSVPVAAFDPIFWGHHANIDRMLALWQAIYPDTYVDPAVQGGGTFTIASGSTQTKSSRKTPIIPSHTTITNITPALTPFHKDTKGTFFTSSDVRNTNTLGYSYPELINKPSNDTLKAAIAALYAGSSPFGNQKRQAANNTLARDYLVKVELPWTAINGTYSVGVFLGKTDAAPADWAKDPKYVGMHATLGNRLDTTVGTLYLLHFSPIHPTNPILQTSSQQATSISAMLF
jgi:tyrosinase